MAKPIGILQFGTSGQLARESLRAAAGRADISIQALGRERVDFRFPDRVADAVRAAGPVDAVINAVAYTAVDRAESEPDLARRINAESVAALARACRQRGLPLIHVSTDYVFDGAKAGPYLETDATNPLGVYGRTKRDGEKAVRAHADRHVIVRSSWVYSSHGANFVRTMLRLGAARDALRVVDDQHGAPTSAADLAGALHGIARKLVTGRDAGDFGTFHYAGGGETTWRCFAEAIFEDVAACFEDAGAWASAKARIVPITTAEHAAPARRPANSRLDCAKIERTFGLTPRPWRESLARVLEELKTAPSQ